VTSAFDLIEGKRQILSYEVVQAFDIEKGLVPLLTNRLPEWHL